MQTASGDFTLSSIKATVLTIARRILEELIHEGLRGYVIKGI